LSSEKRVRWFEDILANIGRIERFTAGMDLAKLGEEEQIFFAVLHALLIISESARRLGTEAEKLAPGPPGAPFATWAMYCVMPMTASTRP
jgi:uncharacterized protein with HEPN domain